MPMRLVVLLTALVFVSFPLAADDHCAVEGVGMHETPIFAGQTIDSGTAYIFNDNCDLIIRAFAENGWRFEEAHAYAGVGNTPVNGGGNPSPGRFPYSLNFGSPASDFDIRIPLSTLDLDEEGCGENVWIALHVVVSSGKKNETGWAFGPSTWSGKRWGWELPYTIQCPGPDDDDDDDGGNDS